MSTATDVKGEARGVLGISGSPGNPQPRLRLPSVGRVVLSRRYNPDRAVGVRGARPPGQYSGPWRRWLKAIEQRAPPRWGSRGSGPRVGTAGRGESAGGR